MSGTHDDLPGAIGGAAHGYVPALLSFSAARGRKLLRLPRLAGRREFRR